MVTGVFKALAALGTFEVGESGLEVFGTDRHCVPLALSRQDDAGSQETAASGRSVVNRPGMVAERAALTAGERGLDFAENGQGDFLGRFSANVEADGAKETCGLLIAWRDIFFLQIGEQTLGALMRAEDAQVGEGSAEQVPQQRLDPVGSCGS